MNLAFLTNGFSTVATASVTWDKQRISAISTCLVTCDGQIDLNSTVVQKKCPTGDESDGASVSSNLAHPAKKAKVDELTALTRVPICHLGKTILNF